MRTQENISEHNRTSEHIRTQQKKNRTQQNTTEHSRTKQKKTEQYRWTKENTTEHCTSEHNRTQKNKSKNNRPLNMSTHQNTGEHNTTLQNATEHYMWTQQKRRRKENRISCLDRLQKKYIRIPSGIGSYLCTLSLCPNKKLIQIVLHVLTETVYLMFPSSVVIPKQIFFCAKHICF